MQALKGLVVGLGILIVIGFVLLIYGFYTSFTNPDFKVMADKSNEARSPAGERANPRPRSFGEVRISLPDGCNLIEMRPNEEFYRMGREF